MAMAMDMAMALGNIRFTSGCETLAKLQLRPPPPLHHFPFPIILGISEALRPKTQGVSFGIGLAWLGFNAIWKALLICQLSVCRSLIIASHSTISFLPTTRFFIFFLWQGENCKLHQSK